MASGLVLTTWVAVGAAVMQTDRIKESEDGAEQMHHNMTDYTEDPSDKR